MTTTERTIDSTPPPAPGRMSFLKLAGPGLIVAATGIGSGDVVAGTVAGGNYGVVLLWAILIGALFKYVLTEGIARWQLATGTTVLEGWGEVLPSWVKYGFGLYLVVWTVAVTAALTQATGLGLTTLTGGAIPLGWAAILHSLTGAAFVLLGGYGGFEKVMKVLVGIMGFSILTCAVLTFSDPAGVTRGLLVPAVPSGSVMYVLSLIGGIGGTITILSYNYWMKEEGLEGAHKLGYVRGDVGVAYTFTALFGVAIALIANQAFFRTGTPVTGADAVTGMANMLGEILGPFGYWAYALGFWAAVSAALLGVWQSIPYMYADIYGILRKLPPEEREEVTRVTSTPYRLGLMAVTLIPIPFAFTGRPIGIVIIYTVVGSFFIPFLATTLLYLNNRIEWKSDVPRNGWLSNLLLVLILAVFVIVGARELLDALA